MRNRTELQKILEDLLGSRNVYYQPPETIKLKYPCIVYSLSDIWTDSANNKAYKLMKRYQIIVVSKQPDLPIVNKLINLQYCSYDRHYISDGLNHDVFTLYF